MISISKKTDFISQIEKMKMKRLFTLHIVGTALIQVLALQYINPPILKNLIKMGGLFLLRSFYKKFDENLYKCISSQYLLAML